MISEWISRRRKRRWGLHQEYAEVQARLWLQARGIDPDTPGPQGPLGPQGKMGPRGPGGVG